MTLLHPPCIYLYEGHGGALQATVGYNPQTMQRVGLADTTWTDQQ